MAHPTLELIQAAKGGEKLSRLRQRQRLIDACISALHLHGPSRTTIDKVVAIADMSPGIVNFYFETKAALLVAALDHLATEFEDGVQIPLEAIRDDPVRALPRLIELYLDPDIASPRKVSVWYAFWGEASARQEYQEICGKRDQAFADLVRDLMSRMIDLSCARHLNADAVALGLIGALEMTWQDIAFREEADIDRAAARRGCQAYLASIFPHHFGAERAAHPTPRPAAPPAIPADPALQNPLAMLIAAELTLANVPAYALPNDWLGYAVLARPPGAAAVRIAILPVTAARGAPFTVPNAAAWDFLALVLQPGLPTRRILVAPRAVVAQSKATSADALAADLAEYADNFELSAGRTSF